MIEIPHRRAAQAVVSGGWFQPEAPGPSALAAHTLALRTGRWWVDRYPAPRLFAVRCVDHTLLRGDRHDIDPSDLAPLAQSYVEAPDHLLPLLGAAFRQVVPWERLIYTHSEPLPRAKVPVGFTVRRLTLADRRLAGSLPDDLAWLGRPWGGTDRLMASGYGWGAFADGLPVAVASTYFRGRRYEDVAVATTAQFRCHGLGLACVVGLCTDIRARGRVPSWTVARDNTSSRRLAWRAGFRLVREDVHHLALYSRSCRQVTRNSA